MRKTTAKATAAPAVKKKGIAQKVVRSTAQPTPKTTSAAPSPMAKSIAKPSQPAPKSTGPARKTAPAAPSTTPTLEPPKKRSRPRVSSETPKDSQAPTFRTLSEQN